MISYSAKLILDNTQKASLLEIMGWERDIFNECSKVLFKLKQLNLIKLHDKIYKKYRRKNPKCPSQIIIRGEQSCLAAHRTARSNKVGWKQPFIKRKLSLQLDKRIFSQKGGVFSIVSSGPRIKCLAQVYPKLTEMLSKYPHGDVKLFVRGEDIYISFPFKVPEKVGENNLALGVDLGIKRFASTSDGKIFMDKKWLGEKRKLRFLKRQLQRAAIDGSKSAKRHLKKLRVKERNKNRNFTHHLANAILDTTANVIVLENLKSIKVKKHKGENKNKISQVGLFQLRQFLDYKAVLCGKRIIHVCPSYTSQIDSRTGLKDGVRMGCSYKTKDGIVLDADINAACNIAARSKLPFLQPSNRLFLGQGIVNSPNAGIRKGSSNAGKLIELDIKSLV